MQSDLSCAPKAGLIEHHTVKSFISADTNFRGLGKLGYFRGTNFHGFVLYNLGASLNRVLGRHIRSREPIVT